MFKKMKGLGLKGKITIFVSLIILFFSAISWLLIIRSLERNLDERLKNEIETRISSINKNIINKAKANLALAAISGGMDFVPTAYAIAHSGDISDDRSVKSQEGREFLRKKLRPSIESYARLHEGKKPKIHFHLPPSRSFLRSWRSRQVTKNGRKLDISDDIPYRQSLSEVNQKKRKSVKGIEISRDGIGIYGIAPVKSASGKVIGSVEVQTEFSQFFSKLKNNKKDVMAIYMLKKFLPIAKSLQNKQSFPLVGDNYVTSSTSNKYLARKHITSELLDMGKEEIEVHRKGNYEIGVFPIRNYRGKTVAVGAILRDISVKLESLEDFKYIVFSAGIVILLFIISSIILLFNHFLRPLNSIIEGLNTTGEELARESHSLSTASQDLASSSTEQAAATQESVSAMEEMSSMIKQTHEFADISKQVAQEINNKTNEGNKTMEKLIDSMESIQNISMQLTSISEIIHNINEKTNVINDIVFKTQLLSFNASIEAARAGQHGKGFAVVAEEVGNLANMSGKAAQEIHNLLSNSRRQVDEIVTSIQGTVSTGREVSDNALILFNQITDESLSINNQIDKIVAASKEQHLGIEQTTQAMKQLDLSTKQNTDVSSQAAFITENLNSSYTNVKMIIEDLKFLVLGGSALDDHDIHLKPDSFERPRESNNDIINSIAGVRGEKKRGGGLPDLPGVDADDEGFK